MTPLSIYISFYTSLIGGMLNLLFARLNTPQKPQQRDLSGQTALVTGANSGLGLSIATSLAQQGATIYLACRNLDKAREQSITSFPAWVKTREENCNVGN
jgi:3-oxoacyl-ACP reductase-like protein